MNNKILIVDDEDFFIQPIKLLLDRAGYETYVANDGMEGLQMTRKVRPDLIMLDLMLPKMNGYQVCRLLKFDESFKSIPVVIVSAKDSEQDRELGKRSGADYYISKPVSAQDLMEKFELILNQQM